MAVLHDYRCPACNYEIADIYADPDHVYCIHCGSRAEIVMRPRGYRAQWSDRDACVVFRDAQGTIRYPARNDVPTPAGFERVEIRSMAELGRFERDHNVTSEIRHYDHGWHGLEREPGYDGTPVAPMRRD